MTSLRSFTLLRTASGSLVLRIIAAGLGFVNGILLARLLGPVDFGVYSIALSAVNLAATASLLGLPIYITRLVVMHAEEGQWNQLRGLINSVHLWIFISVSVISIIAIFLLYHQVIHLTVTWPVILIGVALIFFTAFNQLRAAILRGLHWVVFADIPDMLVRPGVMLVFILGCYFLTIRANATYALVMQVMSAGIAFFAGIWWLLSKRPHSLKIARSEQASLGNLKESLPFLVIAVVTIFESQISLYMLGYFGSSKQAGLFQAASQLVNLIVIGLMAVNMPLQPQLASAWSRGNMQHAQKLLTETAQLGSVVAFAGVIIIFFFANSLLHLFGEIFTEATLALRIIAFGQLVNAIAGSCGILLMMTGRQRIVMWGITFATILNLTVSYLTIPKLGVTGGAIASTASILFWNLFFVVYALKKLGLNPSLFSFEPQNTKQ